MKAVLIFSGAVAIIGAVHGLRRGHQALAATTLVSAWRWGVVSLFGLTAAWGLTVTHPRSFLLLDHLWFMAGLLLLCPPIAVLGARRPGAGVWTAFVILPLIAVLGWPLLTVWTTGFETHPLRLETPALLGFLLVLIMGVGNYLGTRFGLSAALYGVAVCLIVGPVSALAPSNLQDSLTARLLATIAIGLSAFLAVTSKARPPDATGCNRLWEDYRNSFGIVWAKRLQERLNGIAEQQKWPVRLEQSGFLWNETATPHERDETSQKVDQTLRWLLRRFVDPEWIDLRLTDVRTPAAEPPSAAE